MAVIVFGFGLLLVGSLVGLFLEKIGVLEAPAHELRSFAESARRKNGGA